MRFTIDTELERIIVPDTFFNQIDKMNAVLIANGAEDKKIDYVKYINDAIAKVAKKINRNADTVSKYVREYEAAVRATSIVMYAKQA